MILRVGGSSVEVVPEIQHRKFRKNVLDAAFAGTCVLTQHPLMAVYRSPPKAGQAHSPYVSPTTAHLIGEHIFAPFSARSSTWKSVESATDEIITSTGNGHSQPDSFNQPSTLIDL